MTSLETRVHELTDENAALTRIIAQLKNALHQERLFTTSVEFETRVKALPSDAKERLRKAFPGVDLNGLKEAINVEGRNAGMSKQDLRVAKILGGAR